MINKSEVLAGSLADGLSTLKYLQHPNYASGFLGRDNCRNICKSIHNIDYCCWSCDGHFTSVGTWSASWSGWWPRTMLLLLPWYPFGSTKLGARYHHSMVSLFYSPQTFYEIYFGYTSCFITVDFTCEVGLKRRQILWDVLVLNDTVNTLFSILTSPINYRTCQICCWSRIICYMPWNNGTIETNIMSYFSSAPE